jgi:hypothetical protein
VKNQTRIAGWGLFEIPEQNPFAEIFRMPMFILESYPVFIHEYSLFTDIDVFVPFRHVRL